MMEIRMLRKSMTPALATVLCLLVADVEAATVRYSSQARMRLSPATRADIERIANETEKELRKYLPQLPKVIVLNVEVGSNVIEALGATAEASAPGVITWTVDPNRPGGVQKIAAAHLRATLFHEGHHLVRGWVLKGGKPPTSAMDAPVAEGLATVFARDVAAALSPWGEYPANVINWVKELMDLPNTPQTWNRYHEWMFQHPDGRQWVGYKVGTFIADRAVKASGKSAAQLVTVPTAEILRLANLP